MPENILTRKRTSAIRLLLLLAVVIGSGLDLQAQKRDRLITTIRSGMRESINQPDGSLTLTNLSMVEVIGFSLAGVPVTPGQVFQADDDWLTNMRVKVKNISGKSISHLRMSFALPEAKFSQDGRNYSMGISLDYKAGARVNNEGAEMKVIFPSDEVELVYLETGVSLRQEIASRTGVTSLTILQYGGDVTAFFVDGSQWRGSNLPVGRGRN
jgi:hypothetical protein